MALGMWFSSHQQVVSSYSLFLSRSLLHLPSVDCGQGGGDINKERRGWKRARGRAPDTAERGEASTKSWDHQSRISVGSEESTHQTRTSAGDLPRPPARARSASASSASQASACTAGSSSASASTGAAAATASYPSAASCASRT